MSTKIQKFSPDNLRQITDAMNAALESVQKQFGLAKLKCGDLRYEGHKFSVSVKAEVDQTNNPHADIRNAEMSKVLGYSVNIVGREFMCKRGKCVVTGLDVNAPKWNIFATCVADGKAYKFTSQVPLKFLGAPEVTFDKALILEADFSKI